MKKVLIIAVGGTISQTHDENDVAISGDDAFKGSTFQDVLKSIQGKLGIAKIDSKTILNKDSSNMIMEDWQMIVDTIVENYDGYDAFIVTHGTNTMGYTMAAVSFAIGNLGKPVAFTGSQVSYSIPGSDAVINLENILRVCTEHPELVGVFLVFGSKIISGTRVKKKTEFNYDAFKTFGRLPDIGYIGNSVMLHSSSIDRHLSYLGMKTKNKALLDVKNKFDSNIASITEFPGMNSEILIDLAKSGVKGFILRGFGAGDPNVAKANVGYKNLRPAFEYLRDNKIPIVVTTQAPDGVSSMSVNEPGILAKELDAIPAWDMSMETMVTKLSWLIGNGFGYDEIQNLMTTSFRGEIDI